MKKTQYIKYFLLLFFIITVCIKIDFLQSETPILLEGLYATSVNLDYEKYGPHKLFDGSNDYWSTMPGAGPDEGIMLYFEKEIMLESIQIQIPETEKLSKITKVQIYANGIDKGIYPVKNSISIKNKILSLYIRIKDIEGMKSTKVNSDIKGFDKFEKGYPIKLMTGISEIKLYGTNNTPLSVIPPKAIEGKVTPSSTLKPEEAYHSDYLFDSIKESGWVEGAHGSGIGESLKFSFSKQVAINKIKIWNGMIMSVKHFTANERVKKFSFGVSGSESAQYTIKDSMTPQVINLSAPLKGKEFIFKIEDIYKGTAYKDCVISELRFSDGNNWFLIYSGNEEKRKKELLKKINGTILNNIVDKLMNVTYQSVYAHKSSSIILRSNNSFVIWSENEDYDSGKSISSRRVLDGFWDIRSLTATKAEIRIMGKIFNISEKFEAYKGNEKSERIAIFQDTLYVDKNSIKGTKFLGKITY